MLDYSNNKLLELELILREHIKILKLLSLMAEFDSLWYLIKRLNFN